MTLIGEGNGKTGFTSMLLGTGCACSNTGFARIQPPGTFCHVRLHPTTPRTMSRKNVLTLFAPRAVSAVTASGALGCDS